MRTTKILQCALIGAAALLWSSSFGQVTTAFNTGGPNDFVGWAGAMINDPLDIKHEANQPIQWWTNNIQRMLMLPDATYTINGQTSVGDGSLLICPDVSTFTAPGPFTRLHLADGIPGLNSEEFVYRNWMENGITMTGNGDGMYVGQMYHEENVTDATITWSEDFMVDPFNATTSLVV